jgi:hypothetical protein
MTLVKKQYNGRELPVFKNMNQARKYFARRRILMYRGINTLFMVFILIQGILQVLFDSPFNIELMSVGIIIVGCIYCLLEVVSIYAPKYVRLIYSRKEDKWLIFPKGDYPAVAFVRESKDVTIEEDFPIEDRVETFERDLERNAIIAHFLAAGIFLLAILIPIAPNLSIVIASAFGAAIICAIIFC